MQARTHSTLETFDAGVAQLRSYMNALVAAAFRRRICDGTASNVLGVECDGSDVLFTVNGTRVAQVPSDVLCRAVLFDLDGAFGRLRVVRAHS